MNGDMCSFCTSSSKLSLLPLNIHTVIIAVAVVNNIYRTFIVSSVSDNDNDSNLVGLTMVVVAGESRK